MRTVRLGAYLVMLLGSASADADFVIDELYSNADGSVQYVVLHEVQGGNGANLFAGRTLASTHAGVTKAFTFPIDLPAPAVAGAGRSVGKVNAFVTPAWVEANVRPANRFAPFAPCTACSTTYCTLPSALE